jgi:hypothetical protein
MKEIDAIEVEEDLSDTRHLTHPSKKVEVMTERGISNAVMQDDDDNTDFLDDVNSLI